MRICGILVALACLAAVVQAEGKDKVRDCVVKIYATQRGPDFVRPWMKTAPQESVASGVVIEGKRILTNAHVAQYATQIHVQSNDSTEKLDARIVAISWDVDLALLRLEDETFFAQHPALPLAQGIPSVKDKVTVYGYPVGGDQLSVTEGVVSRIDYANGLHVQVDAALNPGNSGGPAVSGDRMVGVVFTKLASAENIGYLIAAEEIAIFLKNISGDVCRHKPVDWEQMQTVENAALRAKLHLDQETGGVMITNPFGQDPAYPLKTADVITQVGPYKLDKKGQVRVRDDLWLSYAYLVPKLATGGKVPVTVIRDGKRLATEMPVSSENRFLVQRLEGRYPRFFVHGPMVFMAACREMLNVLNLPAIGQLMAVKNPLILQVTDLQGAPGEELVVLGYALLNHPIAKGYGPESLAVVTHVNGTAVHNLSHLVELLRDAKGEYITFRLGGRYDTLVFRRDELAKSTEEILANEGIRSQGSDDLLKIWQRK